MANVGGFEFTGSNALIDQANQQIQQLRNSNDLNSQLAANSQQVINAIFSSPEIRKAKETEAALSEALGSVQKEAGESDIDFSIRQNNAVRDRLASVDPNIAVQANDNIIQLNSEKLEQRRLKVGVEADELELKNALQTAVDSKTPVIFRRNAVGDLTAVASLDPDSTPDEINAKIAQLQDARPDEQFVVGSGLDRLKIEDISLTKGGGLNRSDIGDIEEAIDNTATLFFNGNTFMDQMLEAPLSLTAGAESLREAGSFIQGVRRIAGNFGADEIEAEEDAELVQEIFQRTGFNETIEDLGVESGVSRGLVLNMAYTLAKTLDPGGRLSDQDVEMAIDMLIGGGDPNALKKLLRARFEEAAFSAEGHETRIRAGGVNGQVGIDKYARFTAQRESFFEKLDEFERIIDSGGLLQHHRSAFGKSRVPSGDGSAAETDTDAPAPIKFKVRRVD